MKSVDYINDVSISKALITPEMAKNYLNNNPINRRPSEAKIKEYALDMENENFLFTGHSVCFSKSRKLLDGQQRLMSCVKSGQPFHTILVENLPEEVIKVIDCGKKRTYADQLKIDGHINSSQLAAAIKMLALIAQAQPKDSGYTVTQLNTVFNKHKGITESVSFCKNTFTRADAMLSAIHYIANYTGYEDRANQFIETWKGGIKNYENDPVVYIREMLYKDLGKLKKMATVTRMRYIMLSWHKFSEHQEMQVARLGNWGMQNWNKKICGI
jgi:hypothetical protein